MKRPFKESPAWWQAAFIVGIILILACLFSMCGCKTSGGAHASRVSAEASRRGSANSFIPQNVKRIRRPETLNGGNGGASIASVVGHVVSYEAPCTNHFAICCIEWHPCETNQFDHWETVTDTNGIQTEIGRWYCGTNVLRWNAAAGPIYVPEYLDGTNWISDAYFTTNAPGLLEVAQLHYLDTPPHRIWRIAIYEPPTPGGCVGCE